MQDALSALPPELEAVVRLYLFEGLTMEVVAQQLQVKLSTAWYRFRKGSELYACQLSGGPAGRGSP